MLRKPFWLLGVTIFLTLLQISCSQGPSDDAMKKAITDSLVEKIPNSWLVGTKVEGVIGAIVSTAVQATNVQLDLIEVQQRGSYNEEGKYWPVKVRVKGSFQREIIGNKVDKTQFDQVGDFKFTKDDYGNW